MTTKRTNRLVEADGLTVYREDKLAVDRVSLTLDDHEILALVGPSGCGKTSLLRALAGFERPVAGSIRIGGRVVYDSSTWVPAERRGIGLVFQNGALFPHLSVAENIRFGIRGQDDGRKRVAELLRLTGLEELADRFPDQLSGGQAQLVALARALAPEPGGILFDEPFANLDTHRRCEIRDRICEILRQTRTAALFVTHDQEEALSIADRVVVMLDGRILQDAAAETVYDRPANVGVARFIGDSQFLAGRIDGSVVRSLLGDIAAPGEAPADGAVRILVRPEDVRPSQHGVAATVVRRRFFGHDVLQDVELPNGESLAMRVLHGDAAAIGESIRIGLRPKEYQVFAEAQGRKTTFVQPSSLPSKMR